MERQVWAVTAATFTLRFATGLTGALLIFLLADWSSHGGTHAGPAVVALMTALFFTAELVLSPPFGLLSDRLGYHRVMLLGPAFGFVAVILTAFVAEVRLPGSILIAAPLLVGSLPLLGFTRLLEGASTAASVPSILGFIAAATSRDEALRGRASARFEAATIAGLAVGFGAAGPVWEVLGPSAFLANAFVYAFAWVQFRFSIRPVSSAPTSAQPGGDHGWRRYRVLLRRPQVWLLAPTWIALNASLGLYTSQTLFQLIRTPDPEHADQILVGGFSPLLIAASFAIGAAVFFAGLWYWGGRFDRLRRTSIIFYGIVGGGIFAVAALLLNHSGDVAEPLRIPLIVGLAAGLFLSAGATPAALGLLADVSEAFPADRGAIMGLYSVFLGMGQIVGALIGGLAASFWALDGILLANVALLAVALMPLAWLRTYEARFERAAVPGTGV